MSFISTKIRSASVSKSGTVRSNELRGIDSQSAENGISVSRADGISKYNGNVLPGCVNMYRRSVGEVSKRPGYEIKNDIPTLSSIDGVFPFESPYGSFCFYISESVLTVYDRLHSQAVTVSLPCDFSDCAHITADKYIFFMNGNCVFVYNVDDGTHFFVKDDGTADISSADVTYLPTTYIANTPDGSGVGYEAVNLINPYVCEQYIADGESREFVTHFNITGAVTAFVRDIDGSWRSATVDTYLGRMVRLQAVPPAPSVEGEDNVRIVYLRDGFSNSLSKIASNTCGTNYGVGGYKDRVFLSANAKHPGLVFYSELDNPLYFPDLNYIKVGSAATKICALAGRDTKLSVICNDNIYTVEGSADVYGSLTDFTPTAMFVITGIFKTPKPVKCETVVFDGEVNYLTSDGVCAVTASGVLDERCCQIRSGLINRHLLAEDTEDMKMTVWNDYLVISNRLDTLYLLDGKQFSVNENTPFSHRQYEGYVWKNICAKYLWSEDDTLCFSDGHSVYGISEKNRYRDRIDANTSVPIHAFWETPNIYCNDFNIKKFFMRMGVLLAGEYQADGGAKSTGVRISARFDNDNWREIKPNDLIHCVFGYSSINYGRFTYNDRPESYAVYKRLYHKKARRIKLRFENSNPNEPFILQGFNIEYQQM